MEVGQARKNSWDLASYSFAVDGPSVLIVWGPDTWWLNVNKDVTMGVLKAFPKAKPAWVAARRLKMAWEGSWGSSSVLTSIHVHLRHALR